MNLLIFVKFGPQLTNETKLKRLRKDLMKGIVVREIPILRS